MRLRVRVPPLTYGPIPRFGSDLRAGLKSAGYDDVTPLLQGSAVTGRSFRTGAPFDVGRTSDFDVALASPQLLARAKELGIGLRSGGSRTGPLTARDAARLGLSGVRSGLSRRSGRPVNFMIYGSADDAIARSGGVHVP
jgi:filamentous hemagglutinin